MEGFEVQRRIGVMQGRLSPMRENRIQSFPWDNWRNEFSDLEIMSVSLLEWTLDSENIHLNPLLIESGVNEINELKEIFGIRIESVTCDFFMENPPWANTENSNFLIEILNRILEIGIKAGVRKLVIPLVDNSRIDTFDEFESVLTTITSTNYLAKDVRFLFETDMAPRTFMKLLNSTDATYFGVNLDIGNSASYGWLPDEEVEVFGARIGNVHVKDRLFGGSTVPLGEGCANFRAYLQSLSNVGYEGAFILQTARSTTNQHHDELRRNLDYFSRQWELVSKS